MLSFEIMNYCFPVRIFCFDYKKGKTGKPNTWTGHIDKICIMKLLFGNSWEGKPVTMWKMTGKKKHESYPSTFKATRPQKHAQ